MSFVISDVSNILYDNGYLQVVWQEYERWHWNDELKILPVFHKHGEDADHRLSEGEEEVDDHATQGSDVIRDCLHTCNKQDEAWRNQATDLDEN